MERVWLNVIGHKTNDLKVLTPLLLVGYVPCVDVDCHPIRQYVLVMFQKYTQGTPVTLFFISHLYYQNRLKAKDRMSEQYRCKSCGYVFDMKDMMCSECGNGYFELQRWTKGGDGSHWEGCEDVHWDCRIAQLEDAVRMLADKLLVSPVGYMSIQEYNELVKMVKKVLRIDDFVGDSDHEHDDRIL